MPTKLNPGAQAFVDQLRQNVDLARKKGEKQVAGLGTGNYSWANPLALLVKNDAYTAKDLPFAELGVGLANYGWNEQNIFSKLQDSRKAFRTHQKMGGHQDIYNFMMDQAATFGDKKQGQLFKQYLETGTIPSGLTMDTVMQHADYGLRANARKQQRKVKGFWHGNVGAIIGTIGGAIIGCYVSMGNPGGCAKGAKVGAALGGAAGGAGQAVNEDRGWLGTALAAWSGYGWGNLAGSVVTAAQQGAQLASQEAAKEAARQTLKETGKEGLKQTAQQSLLQAGSWVPRLGVTSGNLGAIVNVANQGVASLWNTAAGTLNAATNPVATGTSWGQSLGQTVMHPIQTFQGTGFYQDVINPLVQTGKGLTTGAAEGIASLVPGGPTPLEGFKSGFTSGSGGYFTPAPSLGGVGSLANQPVMAAPNRYDIFYESQSPAQLRTYTGPRQNPDYPAQLRTYNKGLQSNLALTPTQANKVYYGETVRPPIDNVINKNYLTDSITPGENVVSQNYAAYENIPFAGAPAVSHIGDPSKSYFGEIGGPAATTGVGGLPTSIYAKGTLKDMLDPVTPEEYAEDKGFFTENNISRDRLNLEGEGIYGGKDEGDPQLTTYESTSLGQPGSYTPSSGYAGGPRRQLPDYERGALGRRVYAGDPVTLQNQFDLAPYFRTPVFNKGGGVGSCASGSCACPSCYEAGGAVDAGQDKGFPFMGQIPDNMQSKFKAYESGTQSYADSSGEQLEEGYRRVSGSGMEPVEERYIETPAGIQEFFSRTPNGHYRLTV